MMSSNAGPPGTENELFSIVIPARDEAEGLGSVLISTAEVLGESGIPFELLVVDDHSSDRTIRVARGVATRSGRVRCVRNTSDPGIGNALEHGIRQAKGEIVAIMMGDGSDNPADLLQYYRICVSGVDCAFGSRFIRGAQVEGYPPVKLVLNRLGNWMVALAFGQRYRDFTNAFKAYRMNVLREVLPLRSGGFDVTLELPIRAIASGATFQVIPISWQERSEGKSKMKILVEAWRYLRRMVVLRLEGL